MKKNVLIIFGGRSEEHEVSLMSAKNIVNVLNKEKYRPLFVAIDKKGIWYKQSEVPEKEISEKDDPLKISPGKGKDFLISTKEDIPPIDVVFPVLHGPYGEDGTIQGLLRMVDVPFVGSGVLGSSMTMDKEISKVLFKAVGIPTARFLAFVREVDFEAIEEEFSFPVFVKPANLGSSVGITKAKSRKELEEGVKEALSHDSKIIVEEFIEGREIECSVLGNLNPEVSLQGEVKPNLEFYSYDAKYIDKKGADLIMPIELSREVRDKIKEYSLKAFRVLNCRGMARVDFFLKGEKVYINEVNTIPGFTKISMYPQLWEKSGLSYTDLIDKLIDLALENY